MHEMSLMGDILQLVQEDASEKGIEKIDNVELIVGEISNAMPDALEWRLIFFRDQNLHLFTQDAELIIHREEASAECVLCGETIPARSKNCTLPKLSNSIWESTVLEKHFKCYHMRGVIDHESNITNRCIDEQQQGSRI